VLTLWLTDLRKDIEAFEELVSRHEEKVYRLAIRFVHSEADAQEVLQEAFLAAWRNLGKFQRGAAFGTWLYRIAANAARMLLRSQRRRPSIAIEDVPPGKRPNSGDLGDGAGPPSDWWRRPDEQLQTAELRQHIQSAVNALPEAQRAVFLVRDVDGLSTEEAAAALGLTVPTIKTRLHRARLHLQRAIGRYFEGGRTVY
jgi:RNA polymerase sigma-70 factor (ECF subfamily)